MNNLYNPDVLTCLANLSNDEVFTPPEVANQMLNLLPAEIWQDSSVTFLDPACKSGVFLREIAKRLIVGLADEFPDLQQRIDHIFHKQLYGIAITELTSLLARRSVYCAKYANSPYAITHFDDISGNIRFKRLKHNWYNGKCAFCGASQSIGDCGLTIQNIDGEMLPEIGYHIHKKYWRRGFGSEAAKAVRDWAFVNTDFDCLYSYMKYTNIASSATAAANGMKKIKEYPNKKDGISYAYAITREEWEERSSAEASG